ncbi:MAG: DUF4126 domain-containing protein [Candidatus Eremiobacteraeota bacterium]|nr:DUF4126 domain-containing protein [Candidatus Eremiobacteraeota bacterium]MBV8365868.1 DUF4126 domain-containing protein [Candidatus Eremiobacteraeota bacterium]
MDAATQYALAYALTTTAGLRGFLTLFAASVAAHYHVIHPSPAFLWLGDTGTVIVLGVFALLELAADKLPVLDHALHAVSFAARPVAAAILVGGTVNTSSPGELAGLMVAGALNTLVVHTSSATARAASSATTLGIANPALSIIEDVIAIGGLILSFAAPILAAILALIFVVCLILIGRRLWMTARERSTSKAY